MRDHASPWRLWVTGWLVLLLTACSTIPTIHNTPSSSASAPVSPADAPPTTATFAPDFRLPTLAGDAVALRDQRGRWVLINFWATWCIPCREELPYLQQLADAHADQLTVLGINMRESAAEIQPFVEALGITFPILLQPDNETLLAYNIRGLPLSFVVSPQGELLWRQVGPLQTAVFDRWLAEQLLHP